MTYRSFWTTGTMHEEACIFHVDYCQARGQPEIQSTGGRTVIFALRCSPALPASWHNTNAIPVQEHSFLVHSPVNSRKHLDDNGPELAEFLVGKKLLHLGGVEEVNAMGLI